MDLSKLLNLATAAERRTRQATAGPGNNRSWFEVSNQVTDITDIYVHDEIGGYGITSADFGAAVRTIHTPQMRLQINSEGGSVFQGLGIYEILRQHPAHKTAMIDGLAASAASFIAMACDRIEMGKRARMMIHDAEGGCWGPAASMREMADLLDDLSENCAAIYAERAGDKGGTIEDWRSRMTASSANSGTWLDVSRAIELGLADGTIGETKAEDDSSSGTQEPTDLFGAWAPEAFNNMMKGVFGG